MEELLNINDFCQTILIRFGSIVKDCHVELHEDDNTIEFKARIVNPLTLKNEYYQYFIASFNFHLTSIEVKVVKSVIEEIEKDIIIRYNRLKKSIEYANL